MIDAKTKKIEYLVDPNALLSLALIERSLANLAGIPDEGIN